MKMLDRPVVAFLDDFQPLASLLQESSDKQQESEE
jgi:hypothetical protein